MDTAFYNQTGITRGWVFAGYNFYPDKKRTPWLHRVSPFVFSQHGRDRIARGEEHLTVAGFRFNLTRQGFFRIDQFFGEEPWAGPAVQDGQDAGAGKRAAVAVAERGRPIHRGLRHVLRSARAVPGLVHANRPRRFVRADVAVLTDACRPPSSTSTAPTPASRSTTCRILNTRTIYQFNKYFFLRAILQFDSQRKRRPRRLPRLLRASARDRAVRRLRLAPRAARLHRRPLGPAQGEYLTTQRGLFFKASYLYRF